MSEPGDIEMPDVASVINEEGCPRKFIIALDFGTTFSGIAFVSLGKGDREEDVIPEQVEFVDEYPNAPENIRPREVPTEAWYPKKMRLSHSTSHRADVNEYNSEDPDSASSNETVYGRDHASYQSDTSLDEFIDDFDDETSQDYFWGYSVQNQLLFADTTFDHARCVKRFKLLLDDSPETAAVRQHLTPTLADLRRRRLIKEDCDIITDFLEQLFRHAKLQLTETYKFSDDCPVEFVLCVPVGWKPKALRTMEAALRTALRRSNFCGRDSQGLENLFFVSEPEAAATQVLAMPGSVRLMAGDTFLILDAGGGTVDASTYTAGKGKFLRLDKEVVPPGCALCGSSYLNEEFEKILLKRLAGESYLETNGITIRGLVDKAMVAFENTFKRNIDINQAKLRAPPVIIDHLRESSARGFKANRLMLSRKELHEIYEPRLKGVEELMKEQITRAHNEGYDKVILTGGFAGLPALKEFLIVSLKDISKNLGCGSIELCRPPLHGTAVACGAVLRALRKEDGPDRISQSSYGFLRTEPYEKDLETGIPLIPAHIGVKPHYDPVDGEPYVKNAIDWFMQKGDKIPSHYEYPAIHCAHTILSKRKSLICREDLCVADEPKESHYREKHVKNHGAERIGAVIVDMTWMRDEGHIPLIAPGPGQKGQRRYQVEYDLVVIVDGLNLYYEVRTPQVDGRVVERRQTNIAAAFIPGTN